MKNYFAIELVNKDNKKGITTKINGLSVKDAEIIGREMGVINADILNGKIENKTDVPVYQFFNAFSSAFFMATMFYAPERIKKETQHLFNESLFNKPEENKEPKVENSEEKENKTE